VGQHLTECEFRLICGSKKDEDRFVARFRLSTVPNAGESININGNPYVVHERGWACSSEKKWEPYTPAPHGDMTCFIRLTKHHGWKDE